MRPALILAALLGATPAAAQQADWRISIQGGVHIYEDQGFDLVSDDATAGRVALTASWRVWGPLWIAVGTDSANVTDDLHQHLTTEWSSSGLHAGLVVEWPAHEVLVLSARLAPVATRVELSLAEGGDRLSDSAWTFGGRAGLGVEFLPIHRHFLRGLDSDFALGLAFEATYQRSAPVSLKAGTASLGELDPSGPGALLGLVFRW